jgi:hypothetical protein
MDAGAKSGGELISADQAQQHILFMDHNINFIMNGGCSSGVNNTVGVAGTEDNAASYAAYSWTNSVHGKDAGQVAIFDGSVHQTTSSGFRDFACRGQEGDGNSHYLRDR